MASIWSSTSEADLLAALLASSGPAWAEFSRRYEGLIWQCITKVTVRSRSLLSADAPHEIRSAFFASLLEGEMKRIRAFDPTRGTKFSSWIGFLAERAAQDYLREERRRMRWVDPTADYAEVSVADHAPTAEQHAAVNSERRAAADLLATLSERDREFCSLYFERGLSPAAVAAQMGLSVASVYSKRHKIQSRLQAVAKETAAA